MRRIHQFFVVLAGLAQGLVAQDRLPEHLDLDVLAIGGDPVRSERLGVVLDTPTKYWVGLVSTNSSGRLRVAIPVSMRSMNPELILRRVKWSKKSRPMGHLGGKHIRVAEALRLSPRAVRLEPGNVVLAGRVVDRQGRPTPGIEIQVSGVVRGLPLNGDDPGFDRAVLAWRAFSDYQGRYEARSVVKRPGRRRPYVRSVGWGRVGTKSFAGGSTAADLVVARHHTVVAKVLHVPRNRTIDAVARLLPKEPRVTGQAAYRENFVNPAGEYRFRKCFSGVYDFELRFAGSEEVLCHIPDVRVEAGKVCKDPRLMKIDLSDKYHWITISIVDTSGKPVANPVTEVLRGLHRSVSRGGHTDQVFVEIEAGADFKISAPGYSDRTIKNVRTNQRVVLTKG